MDLGSWGSGGYMNNSTLSTFIRPQGYIYCVLVRKPEYKHNFITKKTQGNFKLPKPENYGSKSK